MIYCNNISATYLCQNPLFHSRMKHIEVDFHFVRNQVQNKEVVQHLHSVDHVADVLTELLSHTLFDNCFNKLSIVDTTTNLRVLSLIHI